MVNNQKDQNLRGKHRKHFQIKESDYKYYTYSKYVAH